MDASAANKKGSLPVAIPFWFWKRGLSCVLQSELAVRRLAAALTALALFVFKHEVDCRG